MILVVDSGNNGNRNSSTSASVGEDTVMVVIV